MTLPQEIKCKIFSEISLYSDIVKILDYVDEENLEFYRNCVEYIDFTDGTPLINNQLDSNPHSYISNIYQLLFENGSNKYPRLKEYKVAVSRDVISVLGDFRARYVMVSYGGLEKETISHAMKIRKEKYNSKFILCIENDLEKVLFYKNSMIRLYCSRFSKSVLWQKELILKNEDIIEYIIEPYFKTNITKHICIKEFVIYDNTEEILFRYTGNFISLHAIEYEYLQNSYPNLVIMEYPILASDIDLAIEYFPNVEKFYLFQYYILIKQYRLLSQNVKNLQYINKIEGEISEYNKLYPGKIALPWDDINKEFNIKFGTL